jgi:hypothetical protein
MININDKLIREDLPKIGVDALAVLLCITTHFNRLKVAWPGVDRLRAMTGLSKERAYNAIRTLQDNAYIERWQENKDGKFGRIKYRLTTDYIGVYMGVSSFEMEELPLAGFPEYGKPDYGNADYGNTACLSINEIELINEIKPISEREEKQAAPEIATPTNGQIKPNPSPAAGRFQKPTADEITGYLEDLYIEPQWQPRFRALPGTTAEEIHDYYEANGWKVGRNPMKDWRAACRNWLKNNEKFNRSNTNSNAKPTSTTKKPLVSEETHRRVYAELLHELGVTGGPAQ